MNDSHDLESLYIQAGQALKAKDYHRASGLLKQILLIDENYKDASRLLAQSVKLKRRRWYNDPRLWGTLGATAIVGLMIWLVPRFPMQAVFPPTATITTSPTFTLTPTKTKVSIKTPTLTPTPVPLIWKRIYVGQGFSRDSVSAITLDPRDPDVIYVGMEGAGIYKSINGGVSWQPSHSGIGRTTIDSLVIDPQNPQTVYAGVLLGGLYKTTDGGQNWNPVNGNFDLNVKDIASIVVMDPQDNQHLLYSPAFSLYESTDGGQSWNQIPKANCPEVIAALAMDPTDSKTLFAIDVGGQCTNGLFVSHDGGENWSKAVEGKDTWETHLAVDATGNNIYATFSNSLLYISSDHGVTWSKTTLSGCNAMAVLPEDGTTAYCAQGSELLQTLDGGKNWKKLGNLSNGWTRSLIVSPHDSSILLAGANGITISTDGGVSWENHSNGLGAGRFELKSERDGSSTFYIQQNECTIYRSFDLGQNWEQISDQYSGCDLEFDADGQTQYLTVRKNPAEGNTIRRSRDQGKSWETIPSPRRGGGILFADPHRQGAVFLLYEDSPREGYISLDHGTDWQKVMASKDFWGTRIFSGQDNNNIVYAIKESFLDPARSEDGGKSWRSCLATGNTDFYVTRWSTRAVIDPRDSNHLIIATQGDGILVSTDGCHSWEQSNTGLGSLFVNTLAIDQNNPDTVYAGTDGGAYISFDSGKSWSQINDGLLGATVVYSILVDKDSNVYAATPYGIFKLEGK